MKIWEISPIFLLHTIVDELLVAALVNQRMENHEQVGPTWTEGSAIDAQRRDIHRLIELR